MQHLHIKLLVTLSTTNPVSSSCQFLILADSSIPEHMRTMDDKIITCPNDEMSAYIERHRKLYTKIHILCLTTSKDLAPIDNAHIQSINSEFEFVEAMARFQELIQQPHIDDVDVMVSFGTWTYVNQITMIQGKPWEVNLQIPIDLHSTPSMLSYKVQNQTGNWHDAIVQEEPLLSSYVVLEAIIYALKAPLERTQKQAQIGLIKNILTKQLQPSRRNLLPDKVIMLFRQLEQVLINCCFDKEIYERLANEIDMSLSQTTFTRTYCLVYESKYLADAPANQLAYSEWEEEKQQQQESISSQWTNIRWKDSSVKQWETQIWNVKEGDSINKLISLWEKTPLQNEMYQVDEYEYTENGQLLPSIREVQSWSVCIKGITAILTRNNLTNRWILE